MSLVGLLPLAEISDKVPSLFQLCALHLALAILAFGVTYLSRWMIFLTLPLSIFWIYIVLSEPEPMQDTLLRELGWRYFIGAFVFSFLPLLAVAAAFIMRIKRTLRKLRKLRQLRRRK